MHAPKYSRIATHPTLIAFSFVLFLFGWETWRFQLDYREFWLRTTTQGYEQWPVALSVPLLLLMGGSIIFGLVYVWVALHSRPAIRAAAFLLFSLALLYEYGYQRTLQRFSTPEDALMALLYNDATLYKDAILTFINPWALLPISIFGLLLLFVTPRKPLSNSTFPLVVCSSILIFSLSFRVWFLVQAPFPTLALSAFLRTATYAPLKVATSYRGERDQVPVLTTERPATNLVFIVDESIRGDHLSINGYQRPTTPFLETLHTQGVLYNWGIASAAATCSLTSNNMLLTGFRDLPDPDEQIKRWPNIFQYAQAQGYRTSYLDASATIFWNGARNDLRYIDNWENAERFLAESTAMYEADLRLATRLHTILTTSTGNFIWVNKRGVHFDYNNTFPAEAALWTPVMRTHTHDPSQHAQMVNSYDNGIHYNVDGFFRNLVGDGMILANTVIIYTSDHGQTLAEHGEHWPHCNQTRNEAVVPLFMLAAPHRSVDTNFAASHANIFATLLDLMEIPLDARQHEHALSLLVARSSDSRPRTYYFGGLTGSGEWGYAPFDLGADPPQSSQLP